MFSSDKLDIVLDTFYFPNESTINSCARTGILSKLGEKVKNWKKRYFVLDSKSRCLYYFTKKGTKALGYIPLWDSLIKNGKQNCFLVMHPARRTYVMQSYDGDDRDSWINECNNVIQQGLVEDQKDDLNFWKGSFGTRISVSFVELITALSNHYELKFEEIEKLHLRYVLHSMDNLLSFKEIHLDQVLRLTRLFGPLKKSSKIFVKILKFYCGVMSEGEVEKTLINAPSGAFMVWVKKFDKEGMMLVLTYITSGKVRHVPIMRDPCKDLFYYHTSRRAYTVLSTLIVSIIKANKVIGIYSSAKQKQIPLLQKLIKSEESEMSYQMNTFQLDQEVIVLPKGVSVSESGSGSETKRNATVVRKMGNYYNNNSVGGLGLGLSSRSNTSLVSSGNHSLNDNVGFNKSKSVNMSNGNNVGVVGSNNKTSSPNFSKDNNNVNDNNDNVILKNNNNNGSENNSSIRYDGSVSLTDEYLEEEKDRSNTNTNFDDNTYSNIFNNNNTEKTDNMDNTTRNRNRTNTMRNTTTVNRTNTTMMRNTTTVNRNVSTSTSIDIDYNKINSEDIQSSGELQVVSRPPSTTTSYKSTSELSELDEYYPRNSPPNNRDRLYTLIGEEDMLEEIVDVQEDGNDTNNTSQSYFQSMLPQFEELLGVSIDDKDDDDLDSFFGQNRKKYNLNSDLEEIPDYDDNSDEKRNNLDLNENDIMNELDQLVLEYKQEKSDEEEFENFENHQNQNEDEILRKLITSASELSLPTKELNNSN